MDGLKQCDKFHAKWEREEGRMIKKGSDGVAFALIHFKCDANRVDGEQLLGRNKLKKLMDENSEEF